MSTHPLRVRSLASIVVGVALLSVTQSPTARAVEGAGDPSAAVCSCVCAGAASNDGPTVPIIEENPTDLPSAATPGDTTPNEMPVSPEAPPPKIVFSELLPDPVGKDTEGEFIELRNEGTKDVNLIGWSIVSDAEKIFLIPAATIAGGGYVLFTYSETKLALTNSGTALSLRDEKGAAVNAVEYVGTAKEGLSYAKNDAGLWLWTTLVTPGRANEFPPLASPAPMETPVADMTAAAAADSLSADNAAAQPVPAALPATAGVEVMTPPDASIVISEFLPDPEGSDENEWIELFNDGDASVALAGWIIDDADGGSKPFTLTAADVAPPRGRLLLSKSRTGLALNNDGDSVRLFGPDGQAIEAIRYENTRPGKSFAKISDGWRWSDTPTPGAANEAEMTDNQAKITNDAEITALIVASTAADAAKVPEVPTTAAETVDIGELSEIENGANVTVSGIVNIPGGRIGKTLVGLQNESGTAGIIARFYGADPPAAVLGQLWTVSGKVSRFGNEVRLAAKARDAVTTGQRRLSAAPRAIAELNEADAGVYVSVSGLVSRLGRGSLILVGEDGSGEVGVRLPNGRGPATVTKGDMVTVAGTLRYAKDEPELIVVAKDALKINYRAGDNELGPIPTEKEASTAIKEQKTPLALTPPLVKAPNYAAYGSVAALAAAIGLAVIWWKKRRYAEAPE